MLNLHKSQLVQAAAQVLRHLWTLGGFWVPNITKLATLIKKMDGELAQFNRASLYGLLNFYRNTSQLLPSWSSHCANSWARTPVHGCQKPGNASVKWCACVIKVPCWLNADLTAELRMETRVSSHGIATLLLQRHLGKPRTWTPVASWGRCLKPLEKMESCVLLELKALR